MLHRSRVQGTVVPPRHHERSAPAAVLSGIRPRFARRFKHKLHVCWYERDGALLLRRATNWGRPALGRNGLGPKPLGPSSYIKTLIDDPEGKLVNMDCTDWN